MQSVIQVVAAVIERDGRVLLGRRSPHKRSAPGYWCPVTGRIEAGESHAEAVAREVLEEVGLVVVAERLLGSLATRDGSALIHWWRVRLVSGEAVLRNDEHTAIGWFDRAELAALEPMFPEDRAILAAP